MSSPYTGSPVGTFSRHTARSTLHCIMACLIGLPGTSGFALADSNLPGSIEPGRILQRFDTPLFPIQDSELFSEVPEEPELPVSTQEVSFPLVHVSILGATVYSEEDLLPLWEPRQGTDVSLDDIYTIVDAITAKYRDAGYLLAYAFLPGQRIQHGVVTIHVYEGYLQRVLFEGHIEGSQAILEAYAKKLSEAHPIHRSVLERYLLLINDLPGVQAQSTLRPSEIVEGTTELVITLEHKPFEIIGELNNRGNSFIGPLQLLVGGRAQSTLGLYEEAGFRFATTPLSTGELQFLDVYASRVIDGEGTEFRANGLFSWSNPDGRLSSMGLESESVGFDLTITHPFWRSLTTNIWLSGSFLYQNNRTDRFNGGVTLTRDRLRVLRFRAIGNLFDDTGAGNVALVELSQGLNILNASENGSANLSRTAGRSDFTKLRAEVIRTQPLGAGVSGLLGLVGQYSFDALLASQEFGIGGPHYVRAYDPSEQLGDAGIALKLELQYGRTIRKRFLNSYQVYAFYDFGSTWNRDNAPGTPSQQSLDAAGGGLRATLTRQISGSFEIAHPLAGGVFSRGGDSTSPRVFFSLLGQF